MIRASNGEVTSLPELKIIRHQFVKGLTSAPENLCGGCVDQVAVAIESAQKPFFIKANARLNPLQRIPIHERAVGEGDLEKA